MNFNDLKKPYLIAEIGINHNADKQIIKQLIDASFACGWDCVKFQKRVPELCVPEEQKNKPKETPWGRMTYLEYKNKMELSKEMYDFIDKYCREKPIDWSASVWDIPSLHFIASYEVPFIKIPSAKLTDLELINEACKTQKSLLLSTGMSTLEEIDKTTHILCSNNTEFALLHCNSSYPAPVEELNLKCIQTLQNRYNCPIGYSGHEYGVEPTIYAVLMGAKIIERHITIDHNLWGTDQSASIEVKGMDLLKSRIRDIEKTLGDGNKIITESEIPIRKKLRG